MWVIQEQAGGDDTAVTKRRWWWWCHTPPTLQPHKSSLHTSIDVVVDLVRYWKRRGRRWYKEEAIALMWPVQEQGSGDNTAGTKRRWWW